jgi:hypothetical protein
MALDLIIPGWPPARAPSNEGRDGQFTPIPGVIVDDGGFSTPPTVETISGGGIQFKGKKSSGASGKFIYDVGQAVAGRQYTLRYDPDFTELANDGVTAMVGFGLKQGNSFRLTGLKGDGSTGVDAHEVHGTNKWNQTSGFTTVDGGDAAHGTQAGPNWLRFVVSEDGATYTLRSSADGETWTTEFEDVVPTPHSDVDGVATFGIAVFLQAADAGDFTVAITLWEDEAAEEIEDGDPHWGTVVLLAGFDTNLSDEGPLAKGAAVVTGGAARTTSSPLVGAGSLLCDGSGDHIHWPIDSDLRFNQPSANAAVWTIELRVKLTQVGTIIGSVWGGAGIAGWFLQAVAGGGFRFYSQGGGGAFFDINLGAAGLYSLGDDLYICMESNGTKVRLYMAKVGVNANASMIGSATPTTKSLVDNGAPYDKLEIGFGQFAGDAGGRWDEIRANNETARYNNDAGYVLPEFPFPRS